MSEGLKDRTPPNQEIINTILPETNINTENISKLAFIPKMSTFAIGIIINKIVSEMNKDYCFLNIGVWCGFTFFSGITNNESKTCIGVDNFSEFFGENSRKFFYDNLNTIFKDYNNVKFYDKDYEDYFANVHKETIGFYIYDGEHSYKNQLKGLQFAEPYFSEDCVILVDDTNFEEVRQSVFDFISQSKNKYEILFDVNTANNCHPTFWNGIIIFRKIK